MALRLFSVPDHALRALGGGGGGPDAIRFLRRSQWHKTLLLVRLAASLARSAGHPQAVQAEHSIRTLGRLIDRAPAEAERVLSSPELSACALAAATILSGGGSGGEPPLDQLSTIINCGAASGQIGPRIKINDDDVEIDLSIVRSDPRLFPGLELDGKHPDTAADLDLWRERLTAGWQLLLRYHRAVAEEVALVMTKLVPLADPPTGHNSGTFRHGFGLVAMSLPPDSRTAALTFAHEIQHAKLAATMDLFPLMTSRGGGTYYAPWRPDPRPLPALLHGAYAHLGVAGFWRVQRSHEPDAVTAHQADVQYARWRTATAEATRTILNSGRLTAVGRVFVNAMFERVRSWDADPVTEQAADEAHVLARRHRATWERRHGSPSGRALRQSA